MFFFIRGLFSSENHKKLESIKKSGFAGKYFITLCVSHENLPLVARQVVLYSLRLYFSESKEILCASVVFDTFALSNVTMSNWSLSHLFCSCNCYFRMIKFGDVCPLDENRHWLKEAHFLNVFHWPYFCRKNLFGFSSSFLLILQFLSYEVFDQL